MDNYWNTEQKCRKYTLRLGRYVLCHTVVFPCSLAYTAYCIAAGNYDTSSWFLAYNVLVPFDMSSVVGWLMTWVYQYSMGLVYSLSVTSVTSYFVSCCFYIGAMCDHFELMMDSIREDVDHFKSKITLETSRFKYFEITQKLNNAVKLHIKCFEYVVFIFFLN